MSTTWKPTRPIEYNWPWLARELDLLKDGLEGGAPYLTLQTRNAEPSKHFAGIVVVADGSNWNPGMGAGLYRRGVENLGWYKQLDETDVGTMAYQNASSVTLTGPIKDTSYESVNPAAGTTYAATAVRRTINSATGTKASLTIKAPPSPADGQLWTFSSRGAVTTLTYQDSSGAALSGVPATIAQGDSHTFIYVALAATWYPA